MELPELRHLAILFRGGYGNAICDYCHQNRGTDLHHIISRGRTHNPAARDNSQVLELVSLLCQDCHIGTFNVHNPEATNDLLWFNVHLFGRNRVEDALTNVNKFLTTPILLKLRGEDSDGEATQD